MLCLFLLHGSQNALGSGCSIHLHLGVRKLALKGTVPIQTMTNMTQTRNKPLFLSSLRFGARLLLQQSQPSHSQSVPLNLKQEHHLEIW